MTNFIRLYITKRPKQQQQTIHSTACIVLSRRDTLARREWICSRYCWNKFWETFIKNIFNKLGQHN